MADRATWAKRVAEWRASGRTAAEFCAGEPFAASTLKWWSSQLGTYAHAASSSPPVRVARVVRATAPVPAAATPPALVVELAGARVAVERGFDRETLASVLEVLAARRGRS